MVIKVEAGSTGDVNAVAVSRFGHDPVAVAVAAGATVANVLDKAGVDMGDSEQVFSAGEAVKLTDIVEHGDVLSIVTPKQAGTR